ncbi:MAG TPA: aldehyde dehydrogenase family protein, partial [Actinobacteria bacterium]|nr:aldehyde dehydrogenase family protein [Actinomycetota bacterium]
MKLSRYSSRMAGGTSSGTRMLFLSIMIGSFLPALSGLLSYVRGQEFINPRRMLPPGSYIICRFAARQTAAWRTRRRPERGRAGRRFTPIQVRMEQHMSPVAEKAQAARAASHHLAVLPTEAKNKALSAMAAALSDNMAVIEAANRRDLDAGRGKGLAGAMLDRLLLNRKRVELMAANLRTMAELDDPVGTVIKAWTAPNGMKMSRVRTPIGVIGIVYEARPNVTTDTAGLCIKAGNTIILRGGSEAIHSNSILAKLLSEAGTAAGLPPGAIQFIETTDREAVSELLGLAGLIDLVIARGSHRLIKAVTEA